MRVKPFLIPFLALQVIIALSCFQKEAEWKGTIEVVEGIEVVQNPKEPLYDENVFTMKEDLSIGEAEGREDYMFSLIASIDCDKKENIYVLDVKEAHVKVFNNEGRFIRIIGRRGQGPGELQNPYTVQITAKNEVVIFDPISSKLLFFSVDGDYKKSVSTVNLFNPPLLDSEGNIVSLVLFEDGQGSRYELQKLDLNLNALILYSSYYRAKTEIIPLFGSKFKWALTRNDRIVSGNPDEGYRIKIFNPKGKVIRTIVKDYTPVKVTEEEIENATKGRGSQHSIPKYHNAFIWIVTDEDGRIFVCSWERTKDNLGRYVDVFSPEGKFIVKTPLVYTTLMSAPIVFEGGSLYLVRADEDGYQYVKRYKVTWNY